MSSQLENGTCTSIQANSWVNGEVPAIASNDFDGDQYSDLLIRGKASGAWELDVTFNTETSGFATADTLAVDFWRNSAWDFTDTGYYVNNALASTLLVRRNDNGQWRLLTIDTETGSTTKTVPALWTDTNWQYMGSGDFDKNGFDDVLLRHTSGGWRIFNSDGTTLGASKTNPAIWANNSWEFQAVADFDNNGYDDVLLRDSLSGHWRVFSFSDSGVLPRQPLVSGKIRISNLLPPVSLPGQIPVGMCWFEIRPMAALRPSV